MPDNLSDEVKAMFDNAFWEACAILYVDEGYDPVETWDLLKEIMTDGS